ALEVDCFARIRIDECSGENSAVVLVEGDVCKVPGKDVVAGVTAVAVYIFPGRSELPLAVIVGFPQTGDIDFFKRPSDLAEIDVDGVLDLYRWCGDAGESFRKKVVNK